MNVLPLLAALLATLAAILPVMILARRRPGYSHISQTISELGEAGSRDEKHAAIFAFAPAGHTVWLFVAALVLSVPPLAQGPGGWLFALLGAGYVGAAIFPCDPGAPLWGTWRNNLHNLLAGFGYFGAAGGMIELGRTMQDVASLDRVAEFSQTAGQAAFIGIFLLAFPSPVRGLVQRVVEGLFYVWMLAVGLALVAG